MSSNLWNSSGVSFFHPAQVRVSQSRASLSNQVAAAASLLFRWLDLSGLSLPLSLRAPPPHEQHVLLYRFLPAASQCGDSDSSNLSKIKDKCASDMHDNVAS